MKKTKTPRNDVAKKSTKTKLTGNSQYPIELARWIGGSGRVIRLLIQEYQGNVRVDLRAWYLDDQGELQATRYGFTIPLRQLRPLRKGLRTAINTLGDGAKG